MPVCSLCKGELPPEGGAVLFTGGDGVPFEVCGICEEKFDLLHDSHDASEIQSILAYVTELADMIGSRETLDSLSRYIGQIKPQVIRKEKKKISKGLKLILVSVVFLAFAGVIAHFFGTTISNEFAFQRFAGQLFSYQLPEKTVKVCEVCARSEENNGLRFTAFMLVKSDLELNELQSYYQNADFQPVKESEKNNMVMTVTEVSNPQDLHFTKTVGDDWQHTYYDDTSGYTSYYVVYMKDNGYSAAFDLKYIH